MDCVTDPVETYVTLSHSWGLEPKFSRLLKENFEQWTTKGIPWSDICSNTNFVHAVEVARRIGVRYIWIDSLCIIQNSDNGNDWLAEAPKMQDIYHHSFCNIAASDSSDAYGGIFRSRDGHQLAAARYVGVPGKSCVLLGATNWRVVAGSLWQDGLLEGSLYTRGWVFQERMLAPRILHYSKEQIYWDCATVSACETLPAGMPLELDAKARVDRQWRGWLRTPPREETTMDVDSFWASAVSTYSSSNLTKQKDKLLAIWGIAAPVAEKQKREWGAWGAGLWAGNLEQQLAWTVVNPGNNARPIDPDLERFPTWSWASVVGAVALAQRWASPGVFYTVSSDGSSQKPIFFEQVSGTSSGEEKSVGIKCKSIKMHCHVGFGEVRYDTDPSRPWLQIKSTSGDSRCIQVFPDTNFVERTRIEFLILLVSRGPKREWAGDGYFVIPADMGDDADTEYCYSGLGLLVRCNEKTGVYNRMGVFKFSELSQDQWDDIRRQCGDEGDGNTAKLDPTSSSAKSIILA
ncbi:hypothetical protein G7054_g15201 [Neopestalotiopsis clavispora]|nr:hypothetical protein G7054_g15201 [Neopestalotiopsis clavispora]